MPAEKCHSIDLIAESAHLFTGHIKYCTVHGKVQMMSALDNSAEAKLEQKNIPSLLWLELVWSFGC